MLLFFLNLQVVKFLVYLSNLLLVKIFKRFIIFCTFKGTKFKQFEPAVNKIKHELKQLKRVSQR